MGYRTSNLPMLIESSDNIFGIMRELQETAGNVGNPSLIAEIDFHNRFRAFL
jgi:hypothetical protein